jgi:hypothetical protein
MSDLGTKHQIRDVNFTAIDGRGSRTYNGVARFLLVQTCQN